ncbi:MAG: response regulator transcription factor [Clostridia bacterium]
MQNTPLVLICDDQTIIHETLGVYLKSEGFSYISAFNGIDAIKFAEAKKPDIMILDIMMPGKSGIDVCCELKAKFRVPIIMLTAKGEEIDRILGLELGADDYIVKPFSAREVVARIKAVLRRFSAEEISPPKVISYDGLEININAYEVKVNGEKIPLTPKEIEILQLLAANPGKVFEREQILSKVWGYDYFGDYRAVDTQIKRIRQKLPQEGLKFAIKTVYAVGYKFEVL